MQQSHRAPNVVHATATSQRNVVSRWLLMVALIIGYGVACIVADWWSVKPDGSATPKNTLCAVLIAGLLLMILLQLGWFLPFRWLRLATSTVTIVALGSLLASLPARSIGGELRRAEFKKVVEVGDRLILAIKDFTSVNDRPPASLDELVPTYIDAIPGTGYAAFPEFQYKLKTSRMTWKLFVDVAAGFDRELLVYYSEVATSDSSKAIGDWTIAPKR